MITATHRLPAQHFDELAAGRGGRAAVRMLGHGQLSTRLLRLRALLDLIRDDPGPAAAAARAGGDVLAGLGRERASAVLLHPPVGAWLSRCLSRQLTDRSADGPHTALGHLGGIAAAAAVAAHQDVEVTVPVRAGVVHLPRLGAFPVPAPDGLAALTVADGTVTVHPTAGRPTRFPLDGPGWLPLRRFRVGADGHPDGGGGGFDGYLDVYLDDLDPYRDLPGLALTARLDAAAAARWRHALAAAWRTLARHHPGPASGLAAGLRSVVPLRHGHADQGVSATSTECFGSAAMSRPADPHALALALVHEFQHSKLGALLDLVPLYDRERKLLLYAPWRDDPRPLGGLLQGTYAHLGVTTFWRVQRTVRTGSAAAFAEFEFARWREQTRRAVDVLAGSGALTAAGDRFVAGMAEELDGARADPVPPAAAAAADAANQDHRMAWRVRNLVPERSEVVAAAAAWRTGRPCPGAEIAQPAAVGTFAPAPDARLSLMHVRLREPDRFSRLRGDARALAVALPHALPADLAYAAGDFPAAAAGYAGALRADPESVHAWSGLVLAACRGEPGDVAPELVRAVSDELARTAGERPDPIALTRWAADGPPT